MAEPVWRDDLKGYLAQQPDGSYLISRLQPDNTMGGWEVYAQAAPAAPVAPTPQPQQQVMQPQVIQPQQQPMVQQQTSTGIPQPMMMPASPSFVPAGMPPTSTPAGMPGMAAGMQQIMGAASAGTGAGLLQGIDLSDVQEGGRLIQPEGSIVVATITPDTKMEKTSGTQNDMIHLILKVDFTVPPGGMPTEEFKGVRIDDNVVLTQAARWKFKNVARVCGLLDASGARFIGQSVADFWNKKVAFLVTHDEYNGRFKNKPAGNYEVPEILLGSGQQLAQAMPAAPVYPGMTAPGVPMVPQPMVQQPVMQQPMMQPVYQAAQPAVMPAPVYAAPTSPAPVPFAQPMMMQPAQMPMAPGNVQMPGQPDFPVQTPQ